MSPNLHRDRVGRERKKSEPFGSDFLWWSTGPRIRTEGCENIGQTHSLAAVLVVVGEY